MQTVVLHNQLTPAGASRFIEVAAGYAFCIWDRTLLLGSLQFNCRPGDDSLPNHLMPIVDDALCQLGEALDLERRQTKAQLEHYLNWLDRRGVNLQYFYALTGFVENDGIGILQALRRIKLPPEIRDILFQTHRIMHLSRPLRLCSFFTSRCRGEQEISHLLSIKLRSRGMFDTEFERYYYLKVKSDFFDKLALQYERLRPIIAELPEYLTTLGEIESSNRHSFSKLISELQVD